MEKSTLGILPDSCILLVDFIVLPVQPLLFQIKIARMQMNPQSETGSDKMRGKSSRVRLIHH